MSDSPPNRSSPAPPQKASADFNWPPTDDELAQCFYAHDELAKGGVERVREETVFDGTDVTTEPPPVTASSMSLPALARPPAVPEPPLAAVITHEAPLNARESEASLAVAKYAPALDGGRSEWAAEIAQLQALIEALTEKVEWRIPNATRR